MAGLQKSNTWLTALLASGPSPDRFVANCSRTREEPGWVRPSIKCLRCENSGVEQKWRPFHATTPDES